MNWDIVRDVITAVFLGIGALLSLLAAIGLVRLPDIQSRIHAATKPQVLGLVFIMAALVLQNPSWPIGLLASLTVIFQLITAPISAHMVGRAAYRAGKVDEDILVMDDLSTDLAEQGLSREDGIGAAEVSTMFGEVIGPDAGRFDAQGRAASRPE